MNGLVAIDPEGPGAYLFGNAMGTTDITGPDATGQAETAVVGDADGVFFVLERNRHDHRPEDFFLGAVQVVGAGQYGRIDVVARLVRDRIGLFANQLRAVFECAFDHGFHMVVLLGVVDRADLGFRIAGVTDLELRGSHGQGVGEFFKDRFLHQQARTGYAALPGTGENRRLSTAQGDFQIGIFKHDIGRLAAQLQYRRNATLSRRHRNMATGCRRAHEHDLANVGLGDEGLTNGIAETGNDVDQTFWHARTLDQHADHQRAEGRQFGRFENHRITGSNRRRDLPAAGEDRRVPGRDLQYGAQGLVGHVVQVRGRNRNDLAMQLVSPTSVVLEHLGHFEHFDTRIANRLVGGQGFDLGQVFLLFANQGADLVHGPTTGLSGQCPPLSLSGLRGLVGQFDQRLIGIRKTQQDAVVMGVAHFDRSTVAFDEFAADVAGNDTAVAPVRTQQIKDFCSAHRLLSTAVKLGIGTLHDCAEVFVICQGFAAGFPQLCDHTRQRQLHVQAVRQIAGQPHILAHQAHGETGIVGFVEHPGRKHDLCRAAASRTGVEALQQFFRIDAGLGRHGDRFGGADQVAGRQHVVGNLGDVAGATLSDVNAGAAHSFKDRHDTGQVIVLSTDHHGHGAGGCAFGAAGNRGIDKGHAGFQQLGRDLAAHFRGGRSGIDDDQPLAPELDDAALAQANRLDMLGLGQRQDQNVRVLDQLLAVGNRLDAFALGLRQCGLRQVETAHIEAFARQGGRHAAAHVAQSDHTYFQSHVPHLG
ncbi:hypothetical protein ALP84_05222 [Pseudomonas cichorii]|uniref:Uncharacterized protein n=1 Tax=Pseudomonas cichorii TaxID=36746 RepID=A0A3M4VFF9_PSECI|nr:hypothetical protein ALP84_05222 [Pseudomonas cichorii]